LLGETLRKEKVIKMQLGVKRLNWQLLCTIIIFIIADSPYNSFSSLIFENIV
jgi:hypothetical protein